MTNIAQPERAITELKNFLNLTKRATGRDQEAIVDSAHVVEQILNRVIPSWRQDVPTNRLDRWLQMREAAQRAIVALRRDTEVREMLGDNAPRLNASALHAWVWDSAGPLWLDGHYQQAVAAAAIRINIETQRKTGVRDRSEHDLIVQLFKPEPPKPGLPRLRLTSNDGGKTFVSVHEGVGSFARGAYMAIRNPASHTEEFASLTEHEGLEQLAVFSQLARWIAMATVETAS